MSSCRLALGSSPSHSRSGCRTRSSPDGSPNPPGGTMERITVHGRSLEGNLEGDSPDRPVIVYLPPGYAKETARRYPVLYYLHGYTATAEAYAKVCASGIGRSGTGGGRSRNDRRISRCLHKVHAAACTPIRRRSATGRRSSRRTCPRSSTSNTAPSRRETAADWPGTRWADTARCEWE